MLFFFRQGHVFFSKLTPPLSRAWADGRQSMLLKLKGLSATARPVLILDPWRSDPLWPGA
jgi:hypothetical protein